MVLRVTPGRAPSSRHAVVSFEAQSPDDKPASRPAIQIDVDQVSQQFLYAPFSFGISKLALVFGHRRENVLEARRLRTQYADDVGIGDE